MPYATLDDNGSTVVLDVHGLTVDEAMHLIRRTLREAARRGRGAVKVIHGSSSSDPHTRNRTIKHALLDALDAQLLAPPVTGAWRNESDTLLALTPDETRDATPIRLLDVA
jgi:hypothetical protein